MSETIKMVNPNATDAELWTEGFADWVDLWMKPTSNVIQAEGWQAAADQNETGQRPTHADADELNPYK